MSNPVRSAVHSVPMHMTLTEPAKVTSPKELNIEDFISAHNALNNACCRVTALVGDIFFFDCEADPADKAYGRRVSYGPYTEKQMINILYGIRLSLATRYDERDTF